MTQQQEPDGERDPDNVTARALAIKMVEALSCGDVAKTIQELGSITAHSRVLSNKAFGKELRRLLHEGEKETPVIAAFLLLTHDEKDDAATAKMIQVLNGDDHAMICLAMSYLARLPRSPAAMVSRMLEFLQGADQRLRLAAAVALREAAPEAIRVLIEVLRGRDENARIYAAATLGRIEDRFRPKEIDMDQIMSVLTGHLETQDESVRTLCIQLIGEVGPRAAMAVPALLALINNPLVGQATRTIIVDTLGRIGSKGEAANALADVLRRAVQTENWLTILWATHSLAEIGEVPMKAVDALIGLLKSSDSAARIAAVEGLQTLGPHAAPAVPALIDRIGQETDTAFATIWARAMGAIGEPAIQPLVKLLTMTNLAVWPWAAGALVLTGESGAEAVVNVLLTDPDEQIREISASILHGLGKKAVTAVPAIIKLLDADDGRKHLEVAVVGLKGLGAAAKDAAPALVRHFLSETSYSQELARDGLIRIGPDSIPALQLAYEQADTEGKRRIAEVLKRWDFAIERHASSLDWFQDEKLLEFYARYGQLLQKKGAVSSRAIAKEFGVSARTVLTWIKKLEGMLGKKEGREVRLTERTEGKKGGLILQR